MGIETTSETWGTIVTTLPFFYVSDSIWASFSITRILTLGARSQKYAVSLPFGAHAATSIRNSMMRLLCSILAPGTRICFLFAMYTDIVYLRAHKSRGIVASSSTTGIASPVFAKSMHFR